MTCESNLSRGLEAGHFAVTAELGPPMGADADHVRKKGDILHGCADAINITDCQTAVVRLSSIAAAILLLQGHPGAKNVYDIDSIQMLAILRGMRDEARQQGGDPLDSPPSLFLGAAWTPMGDPVNFRVIRLAKKVAAGAQFIQTQGVYDVSQFADVMRKVRSRGLHEKTAILGGIIVPRSGAASARGISLRLTAPGARPVQAQADEDALRLILGNMIDNAVRYSMEDTTVEVRVEQRADAGARRGARHPGRGAGQRLRILPPRKQSTEFPEGPRPRPRRCQRTDRTV